MPSLMLVLVAVSEELKQINTHRQTDRIALYILDNLIFLPAAVLTIMHNGEYCDVIQHYDVTLLCKRI